MAPFSALLCAFLIDSALALLLAVCMAIGVNTGLARLFFFDAMLIASQFVEKMIVDGDCRR
jgi:hypothetical protein